MTTDVRAASGPVPMSRVWTPRKVIAENLTGDDLGDVLDLHSDAYAWWVLPRDDGDAELQVHRLVHALGLDDLVAKDLLAQDRRAKFETVGPARVVVTNAVSVDPDQVTLQVHPVSVVVTDRALICLVGDTANFRPAQLFEQHADRLSNGGVEAALQALLTAVINTYENAVTWIEDASDDLSDTLFAERPLNKTEQLRAFRLRAALSQLRRLTEPMRAVMADVVASPPPLPGKKSTGATKVTRSWKMVEEKHQRVAGAADALRESLSSIFQTSLGLSDLRMNEIMRKLTAWAAIIAVPTLVTGFVGMNVAFPLDSTGAGFWVALVIMVVASAVLYVAFKIKHWV